jgi:transposase
VSDCSKKYYVGLDVHKETIVIAVAEPGRGPARSLGTIPFDLAALRKVLARLGPEASVTCCYEAGPTGYGLARDLIALGWGCDVIAPSLVPRKSGDRIKTDRRDGLKLAVGHRNGELTAVVIPDERAEAIRDLSRAREDAKKAEMAARHQLGKFLLRQGRRYPGKSAWTEAHRSWVAAQEFAEPAHRHVLADAIAAVDVAGFRCRQLTERLRESVAGWRLEPLVKALQALRGVEFVTAVGLCCEVVDFRRFAKAGHLMSYLGLVPSEESSGGRRRQGPITKAGNGHARRLLVESAWHYRRQPRMSKALRDRRVGLSPQVCGIAWKAQKRLHGRLRKMIGRGKRPGEAATATARELAGFVWAIAREVGPGPG